MKSASPSRSFVLFFVFISISLLSFGQEQDEDAFEWPKELETKNKAIITLYQPQLESLNGNILEGRMAITINPAESTAT